MKEKLSSVNVSHFGSLFPCLTRLPVDTLPPVGRELNMSQVEQSGSGPGGPVGLRTLVRI